MTQDNTFHTKYRPESLSKLIGHDTAVTRLKGLVAKGVPGAILLTGPTSVGKTTLARALACEVNGVPVEQQTSDYKELDAGSQRSIEDVRDLIKVARFKPQRKRRFIVIDEAQSLLSNNVAATALLKSLEDAGKSDTTWILCSMDPTKFSNSTGRAIANRCVQFVLNKHTNQDLFKQGTRIIKGEKMGYVSQDMLKEVVKASSFEMRTLASLLQGIRDYYEGLDKKPKELTKEIIDEVLQTIESSDDKLIIPVIVAALKGEYAKVHRNLLDVEDGFGFINKLLWAAQFLLNNSVLNGSKHRKVWFTATNRELLKQMSDVKPTLGKLAALNATMVEVKARSASFAVPEQDLISTSLFRFILEHGAKK